MLGESVLYESVSELAKRIESKQLSPVELTESYLARSEKLDPKLHAYARLTPDLALEQAHAAEKESPPPGEPKPTRTRLAITTLP
jgi:Asp-tRNA(Asn)/Glu-tRNA(Gln) amidotransferase A subunit family amidase